MMGPVLILTVGLPGSGKSTWARKTGLPIVNPDSIRQALHGQEFYGPAEPMVWATAKLMVASLFLAGHQVVILDATNVSVRRRQEWRSGDWDCAYINFKVDPEECKRRVRARGFRSNLDVVIDRMAKELDYPDVADNQFGFATPVNPGNHVE